MSMTLAEKAEIAFYRKNKLFTSNKYEAEALSNYLIENKLHEKSISKEKEDCYIFSDNSVLTFYKKPSYLGYWYEQFDYYHEFNDYKVNQGFPVGSNKKDFVEGSVIEVMFKDCPPLFAVIVDMDKRPHNFKGDFDIKIFDFSRNKIMHTISQTQIKRLVTKDIENVLMSSAFV